MTWGYLRWWLLEVYRFLKHAILLHLKIADGTFKEVEGNGNKFKV